MHGTDCKINTCILRAVYHFSPAVMYLCLYDCLFLALCNYIQSYLDILCILSVFRIFCVRFTWYAGYFPILH